MKPMPKPTPDAPILSWSVGRSKTTATWSAIEDQSWSAFVRWLEIENPADEKEVRPYVGATLQDGKRTIRTVEKRFLLTLDADYADDDFLLDVAIELADIPYLIHSTWRHTPESPRYRLIIPLSRGVLPNEYKSLAWTVMNRLGGERFDVTTAQAERFMWGPSAQDLSTYHAASYNPRAPYLPVNEWLDGHHGPSDAPAGAGRANPPPPTYATGSGALKASAEDRERAAEILEQACRKVERVYEDDEYAGRNEAVFHLMPLLFRFCDAEALDEDTVIEALWEAAQRVPADEPYERREFNASVRSARQYAFESGPTLPETTATKMAIEDFEGIEVEDVNIDDLWSKTPRLKHIAQAADSLGRNRLGLLAVTVARVLAEVDPVVRLPGIEDGAIGDRAALNLGVALVGSSGQGKSQFISNSRKLLGREIEQKMIEGNPSTGQGLIQEYLRWDAEANANVTIDDPRRIFIVDEIDKLGALGQDTGSTLLGEIRTMLTGGTTGSSNATRERRRILHGGSYNFQLVIGVQPQRAGALLEGRDAGMPQRFVWVPVTDPKTALHPDDRPPWPGSIQWSDAFLLGFELGDPIVRYPQWLVDELKRYDYRVSQEESHGGKLSRHGHFNLLRLKVAAGIAFLHESPIIEDLHVEIADMILASSKKTQRMCENTVSEILYLKKKATRRSDERLSTEMREERLEELVKGTREKLLRAEGKWLTAHELRIRANDRAEYWDDVWEAIAAMDDVEVHEKTFGGTVRRKARING